MVPTQLALDVRPAPVDPDQAARDHYVKAVQAVAYVHDGVVSINAVRDLVAAMPEWGIPSHVPGKVISALRQCGRLVEIGTERSTDTRGGNAGRWISLYRWVSA